MKKKNLTFLLFLTLWTTISFSQEWSRKDLTIYRSFDELEKNVLDLNNDTTYVINFWATWCGPCVKELPYFEALNEKYKNEKLKVILVSLDFEKQIDKRLITFLNKNKIQSDVVLLLDPKESSWIDRVDPEWSGAIPVSIVKKGSKKQFYEKVFHSVDELEEHINPILNY